MAQIVLTQSHDDRGAAFTGAAPFSRRLRDAFEIINTPMRDIATTAARHQDLGS